MLFYCCWLGDGRQWYTSAVHLAGLPSHLARLDVHLAGLSAPCTPGRQSTWQGLIYTCRASCTPGRSSYTPGRAWRTPGRAVHLAGLDVHLAGLLAHLADLHTHLAGLGAHLAGQSTWQGYLMFAGLAVVAFVVARGSLAVRNLIYQDKVRLPLYTRLVSK